MQNHSNTKDPQTIWTSPLALADQFNKYKATYQPVTPTLDKFAEKQKEETKSLHSSLKFIKEQLQQMRKEISIKQTCESKKFYSILDNECFKIISENKALLLSKCLSDLEAFKSSISNKK